MPDKVRMATVLWLSFSSLKIGKQPMSKLIRVDYADLSIETKQRKDGQLELVFKSVYLDLLAGAECTEQIEFFIAISEFQLSKSADGIVLHYVGKDQWLIRALQNHGYENKISEQADDDLAHALRRM